MRKGEAGRHRRDVIAVGGLLSAVVVTATLAGPWNPPLSRDRSWSWDPFGTLNDVPRLPRTAAPLAPLPRTAHRTSSSIGTWIIGVLVALAVAAAVLLLVPRLRRLAREVLRGLRAGDGTGDGGALRVGAGHEREQPDLAVLDEGLLAAGWAVEADHPHPADAVLAAWVALERAARRSGVERDPASTPTEFTVDVLDRTSADRAATRTLLALYLRARFGSEAVTPDDVGTARTALATLRAGLATSSRGPATLGPTGDGR